MVQNKQMKAHPCGQGSEQEQHGKETAKAGAVILAAGYSSRMGAFKPMLPIGEKTALGYLVDVHLRAGITNIAVVTGYQRELVAEALQEIKEKAELSGAYGEGINLREVYNADFPKGMFTSIQRGLGALFPENAFQAADGDMSPRGCFLTPVDCPVIPEEIFSLMLEASPDMDTCFAVPCYQGKKGHPLWLPKHYIAEILRYKGNEGLKGAMKPYEDKLLRIETDLESVVLDMDTREGYQEILEYMEGRKKVGVPDFKGRLILVRHGETEQHKEKVFLGQTDVMLNEAGRQQALQAGLEIADYNVNTEQIYVSNLKRTMETAKIITTALGVANDGKTLKLQEEASFREMHLGDWDGKFIREMKDQFPEEYEKRGKNLLQYKTGNQGENYYDLQYRVMKRLHKILEKEAKLESDIGKPRDVVIVTHLGVIRVMLANLMGTTLEEALLMEVPKGAMVMIEAKQ